MVATEQTGIMAFVAQYGQVIYFFAQIAFWLVLSVAALWATLLFRKLVAHQTAGVVAPESLIVEPAVPAADEKPVKVEEFVE